MSNDRLPVFVYGTLRKGFWNYISILKGRTSLEVPATLNGSLYIVGSANFPALMKGSNTITGDLMYLRTEGYVETMKTLDMLEGYREGDQRNSMYLRKKVFVRDDGKDVEAWVYIWNRGKQSLGKEIKSGDFADYIKEYKQPKMRGYIN